MKKERNEVAIRCGYGEMVAIDALKPHPRNPNHHPPKQIALLARLIRRVGMRQPITVSNLSGYIVRGHGRLEACRALKMAEVPVDFQDYADEAEEMADLLADNRIPELAELDLSAAWKNLGDIASAFKLEDLGFMKSEFKDVNLQQLLEEPINAEVAEAVAPPKEAEIYETSIKPTHFPSSSKWGIPDIRADRIPRGFEVSGIRCNKEDEIRPGMLFLWGSNKFPDDCKRGVVGFYVDDVRFADLSVLRVRRDGEGRGVHQGAQLRRRDLAQSVVVARHATRAVAVPHLPRALRLAALAGDGHRRDTRHQLGGRAEL